jgi:hypothetical protein
LTDPDRTSPTAKIPGRVVAQGEAKAMPLSPKAAGGSDVMMARSGAERAGAMARVAGSRVFPTDAKPPTLQRQNLP